MPFPGLNQSEPADRGVESDPATTVASRALPRIGAGWQYVVYDLGNGRVLKVPLSPEQRAQVAHRRCQADPSFSRERAAAWVAGGDKIMQRSYQALQEVLPHLDARLLGNPTLLGHGIYEQDKLVMVGDYIRRHAFQDNAAVIDRYIETTIELWRWGVSEEVFNFSINSGVGRDGRVALCDLGELTTSRSWVLRLVTDQVWLQRWSYRGLADGRLKAYIRTRFAERLTPECVTATWGELRETSKC